LTRPHVRKPPLRRARLPRGALGFIAIAAAAILILTAGTRAMPASFAQDASPDPCASPGASPDVSPEASPAVSPAIEALQEVGEELAGTPSTDQDAATPVPCPPDAPAAGTPSVEDQLATAAAVIQAATAAAPTAELPPTATLSPEVGEIAEALPPVDLPVTNPQGFTFNLEASLTVGFDSVVPEAPVYRLTPLALTYDQVQALADGLGIAATVDDRGNGNYTASGAGQLFVTPTLIQYLSPAQAGEGELPDDQRSVEIARDWLRSSGLVQPDLGEGRVVSRVEEAGRVVVVFTPVEPPILLSAYPSISISLGPNGVVLEAASRWATIQRSDLYSLRPAEDAWRQVERGQAYIEADLAGAGFEEGAVISGLVRYDRIDVAYTTAGPPGGIQYLAPVYMFTGTLTPEGRTENYTIRAYVPAMASSAAPVGRASGAVAEGGR
jgi:hypothetical protein